VAPKVKYRWEWAGVHPGDAFKNNLDYHHRLTAQRLLFALAQKARAEVARAVGAPDDLEPRVKVQLSAGQTDYPSALSAAACVGHTIYLELEARIEQRVLLAHLGEYLENPAGHDQVQVDGRHYARVARVVAESIQVVLVMEDLSRVMSLPAVEIYRLFSASQAELRFDSVDEVIRTELLYGDVLVPWETVTLHPMTVQILNAVARASRPYRRWLGQTAVNHLPGLGEKWVRDVCRALARFLPEPEEEKPPRVEPSRPGRGPIQLDAESDYQYSDEAAPKVELDQLPPLDGPHPPSLTEPEGAGRAVLDAVTRQQSQQDGPSGSSPAAPQLSEEDNRLLSEFGTALDQASGQASDWEDTRSELMSAALAREPFKQGPIEGQPTQGHEVKINLAGNLEGGGEIFDRPVEPSDDLEAYQGLLNESRPMREALKRLLYVSVHEKPETLRLRSSGLLDPSRLPLAGVCAAVFKRYRIRKQADRKGRPVVVIACDGSGSLDPDQMKMLKVLCAGWLGSVQKSGVTVLAALYHSGQIRRGVSGPLVRWIFHPRINPVKSPAEAVRGLVALPDTGTGVQSDALSLAYIMDDHARVLAKGNMIYLILLSDCAWNRSFHTGLTGQDEVRSYLESLYGAEKGRLHVTLVGLGVTGETGFEDLLDRVITVSGEQLADHAAVAERIGTYVASCMRERQTFLR
jgi:hypothetical protein